MARDYGFDRSMIMGYGHDDRVCAYPSFQAILKMTQPKITSVCLLVDKEEIGSVGATGMHSRFFEDSVAELLDLSGAYSELSVRRAMRNSKVLSSDVSAAYDPMYAEVFENAVLHSLEKDLYSTSLQVLAERAVLMTQMQNILQRSEMQWMRRVLHTSSQNLEK